MEYGDIQHCSIVFIYWFCLLSSLSSLILSQVSNKLSNHNTPMVNVNRLKINYPMDVSIIHILIQFYTFNIHV